MTRELKLKRLNDERKFNNDLSSIRQRQDKGQLDACGVLRLQLVASFNKYVADLDLLCECGRPINLPEALL